MIMKKKKEVKFWNDSIQEIAKLRKPVVMGSTHLVVIRDWISPYNSNMKDNHAPAEYWAKKLGKDTNTFIKDFENGCLDQWFKVYCP